VHFSKLALNHPLAIGAILMHTAVAKARTRRRVIRNQAASLIAGATPHHGQELPPSTGIRDVEKFRTHQGVCNLVDREVVPRKSVIDPIGSRCGLCSVYTAVKSYRGVSLDRALNQRRGLPKSGK